MRILHPEAFVRRPAAVLFDLDHTFYEYDQPHTAAMTAARGKLRRELNVSGKRFDAAFSAAREELKDRLGATASSHSRLLYFQATLVNLGLGAQPLMALNLEQTYWRTFLAAAHLAPGSEEVLIELRALSVKLALVTDLTAQIQLRKLVFFGLEKYFDVVMTSEEAGVDKSGLVPFTLAAARLGLTRSDRVWMVGDSAHDIAGSRAALGATTIQKMWDSGGCGLHSGVDATIHDFSELLRLVSYCFGNCHPSRLTA